ncbi:NADP-dependent oxidoreductase domain-containing protein [Aspergillus undulatus]|uniref:NADP-dependent oxidoreductase domain-containing protein n=1 Tax=Aspergillus undulatus TaxID=1810928 RepID=UPI003CCD4020
MSTMSVQESKVHYRRLGNSGLRVSVPIFGCMSLSESKSMPWPVKEEEALPLLKAAYDRGINTWDAANVYGNGASEVIVGKALKKYSIPREKVVIMTKCFWGSSPSNQNQFGLSRTAIFNQNTSTFLQIHRFDSTTPLEKTMKVLHDLVKSGKVRYIGASSMWATQFARLHFTAEKNGWTKFVGMQNQYNLLYPPLCRGHLARAPVEFGSTARSVREEAVTDMKWVPATSSGVNEVDLAIIKRVVEIAEKRRRPMAHVSLAWINKRVASPIIGFSKIERVEQAICAVGKVLSDEEERYMEERYLEERYLEELYQPKAVLVAESL